MTSKSTEKPILLIPLDSSYNPNCCNEVQNLSESVFSDPLQVFIVLL